LPIEVIADCRLLIQKSVAAKIKIGNPQSAIGNI